MFKKHIIAQYILIAISVLTFIPLANILIGGLSEGIDAWVSRIIFFGFVAVLAFKVHTQARLLMLVDNLFKNHGFTESVKSKVLLMVKKYKRSYYIYFIFHILILTALVPFLHLLTIWGVSTLGFLTLLFYAERKFFFEIDPCLSQVQTKVNINTMQLKYTLIVFYILLPGLFLALWTGLQALGL